jgi:hypothetical protein
MLIDRLHRKGRGETVLNPRKLTFAQMEQTAPRPRSFG